MRTNSKRESRQGQRGVALLMVLIALSVLSVLVLGYISSMTTELGVASAVEKTHRTKLLADGALAHAIDILRSNIPEPEPISAPAAASAVNWVTNPGRLTVIRGGRSEHIDLHSGISPPVNSNDPPDAYSVDLNRPIPGNSTGPIAMNPDDEKPPEMRIAWIPVLSDPARQASRSNKLRGRYAFWIDDESTKVNVSTALGKPTWDPDGGDWAAQLRAGFPTPQVRPAPDYHEIVSLGHPSSINVDVLFDDPDQFKMSRLFNHQFLHGFHRFPDSVINYTEMRGREAREWMNEKRWHFTFYGRSPEFNVFGRSRLFSLHQPSSLDAGPAYQQPFTNGKDSHFQAIFSSPGYEVDTAEATAAQLKDSNAMTLSTGKVLANYFGRKLPGWGNGGQMTSLRNKYGGRESAQIILNLMTMSRLATTPVSLNPGAFPDEYAKLVTSSNFLESDDEDGKIPEQSYWRINDNFDEDPGADPMLPQTPGPHLNEIKFVVIPEEFFTDEGERMFRLLYRYEVEYYMHPMGPLLRQNPFPAKVDFLKIEAGDAELELDDDSWDSEDMRKLIAEQHGSIAPTEGGLGENYTVASSGAFYLSEDGETVTDEPTEAAEFEANQVIDVELSFRVGLAGPGPRCKQVVPLGTNNTKDVLTADFKVDLTFPDPDYFVSWEVEDPRVSRTTDDWIALDPGQDSMGEPNTIQPPEEGNEFSKFKSIQLADLGTVVEAGPMSIGSGLRFGGRIPSNAFWSTVHTGIQSSEPWKTLSLSPDQQGTPDWILLDLLASGYPMPRAHWNAARSLPDTWSAVSYLNATAGKINLNNRIYPADSPNFQPPERTLSTLAVFRNLRPDPQIEQFAKAALNYQKNNEVFDYVGEIAEVAGYAEGETDWEKESLLRNMASALTTQSNSFGVWGIAQSVRKDPSNKAYDEFQWGDSVVGERRFFALVERHVWPGKDGVPGNGHTTTRGIWDRIAKGDPEASGGIVTGNEDGRQVPGSPPTPPGPKAKFAALDGPTQADMKYDALFPEVPYTRSSLADAYNPADAVIKYRILYFKYLDH